MMFSNLLLGVALAVVSPTNAPAMFSTETEQMFLVPDITERSVWLDCGIDFTATPSNRIEVAFGPDVDGDGLLGDDESPFSLVMDCGRMIVRDGKGNQLYSAVVSGDGVHFSFLPAHGGSGDAWKIGSADAIPVVQGEFTEGTSSVTTWNLARVRMSGPDAAAARVSLQKNRFATVFIVR